MNLGEYWNEEGMVAHKNEVINFNKGVGNLFKSAYHYLAAAKQLRDDIDQIIENAVDKVRFNQMLLELKAEILDGLEVKEREGKVRHLFDSAITPDGVVDYINTIITKGHKCYYLKGDYETGCTVLLNDFARELSIKGYDVELYHQPLDPDKLQTLVIDDLDIAITTNPKLEVSAYLIINMDRNINSNILKEKEEIIAKDRELIDILMNEAVARIGKAKKLHDEMETHYVTNMNFEAINEFRDKIIERIKNMI